MTNLWTNYPQPLADRTSIVECGVQNATRGDPILGPQPVRPLRVPLTPGGVLPASTRGKVIQSTDVRTRKTAGSGRRGRCGFAVVKPAPETMKSLRRAGLPETAECGKISFHTFTVMWNGDRSRRGVPSAPPRLALRAEPQERSTRMTAPMIRRTKSRPRHSDRRGSQRTG